MSDAALRRERLEEIVRLCREESTRSRSQECGHCFELFRRAIEERDQAAWTVIGQQYHRLMLTWVPSTELPADAELLVRDAMARFWRTLSSGTPISERFDHLGALLKYLRQCTISALLDHQRQARRVSRLKARLELVDEQEPLPVGTLELLCQEERIGQVRAWLKANVTESIERKVLELSYEQDLSPAEIAARYPGEFPDVHRVRRIKERILRRVKRALEETG